MYTWIFVDAYVVILACTQSQVQGGKDRLIGCLKLQVIFCKRATAYRAFFWKMTGRAATRRAAPTLPRAMRAGPNSYENMIRKTIWEFMQQ